MEETRSAHAFMALALCRSSGSSWVPGEVFRRFGAGSGPFGRKARDDDAPAATPAGCHGKALGRGALKQLVGRNGSAFAYPKARAEKPVDIIGGGLGRAPLMPHLKRMYMHSRAFPDSLNSPSNAIAAQRAGSKRREGGNEHKN